MVSGTAQPVVPTATGQLWEPREQPQAPPGLTAVEVTRNGLPELWLDYTLSLGPTWEDKGQADSQLEISGREAAKAIVSLGQDISLLGGRWRVQGERAAP